VLAEISSCLAATRQRSCGYSDGNFPTLKSNKVRGTNFAEGVQSDLLFLDGGLNNYYPANVFQCWRQRVLDQASIRNLTNQLAEDLSWLEQHCRRQGNHAPQAGELRLAEALVRNTIGPYLDQQPPEPLHVAVVGGAGAGKSTVANMLSGSMAAESNPQAGFTRHPVA
jgi:50S ribosome-binding GTPase